MDPQATDKVPNPPGQDPTPEPAPAAPVADAQLTPPVPAPAPADPEPKTIAVPEPAFARIKSTAYDKGKREALEEAAKKHGYDSWDSAFAALEAAKQVVAQPDPIQSPVAATPPAPAAVDPDPIPDPVLPSVPMGAAAQKAASEWQANAAKMQRRLDREVVRRKDGESKIAEQKVRFGIQRAAIHAGIKDDEYGVALAERHLAKLSDEEVGEFDPIVFFKGLKEDPEYAAHFQEVKRPATTGNGKGAGSPSPQRVAAEAGAGAQFDARTATAEEFREHLRLNGLAHPSTGSRWG